MNCTFSDSRGAHTLHERKSSTRLNSRVTNLSDEGNNSTAGLLAEVGVCSNAAMDQYWEMYEAYKSKKPWQSIKDTAWGKSTTIDQKIAETTGGQYWLQKGKGSQWLAACKEVNIEVVGKYLPIQTPE